MTLPYITSIDLEDIISPKRIELKDFVKEINNTISPLGLELRSIVSDYNNIEYYGICQIFEDPNCKESLGIKPEVIKIYYRFLDAVVEGSKEGQSRIPYGTVVDMAPEGFSQMNAQDGISQLRDLGYIDIIEDKISIGPRGLLEFRPKFSQKATEDDESALPQCMICLEFILAGKKCQKCKGYMHSKCLDLYSMSREDFHCPQCQCSDPFEDFGY